MASVWSASVADGTRVPLLPKPGTKTEPFVVRGVTTDESRHSPPGPNRPTGGKQETAMKRAFEARLKQAVPKWLVMQRQRAHAHHRPRGVT